MVGEVGAGDGGGLLVDLGVKALELARMTFASCSCTTRSLSACSLRMLARATAMSSGREYMLGRVCGFVVLDWWSPYY